MMFRTLFGWRLWLALTLALGVSNVGCDKLGFGDKKDSKSKKDKDKDKDDDDDDDDKKKKKKKDDDKASSSSSASSADSGSPPTAETGAPTASGDSSGIAECDLYLESYKKCIPSVTDENIKQMRDAYKMGAAGPAKESLAKSCKDSIETIKKACPGKL